MSVIMSSSVHSTCDNFIVNVQADLGASDDQGRTALHYAISIQSLPCVQAIVETNVSCI